VSAPGDQSQPEPPRRLRVGLVGCGFIARHHAEAYRLSPLAELVAVCDPAVERARALGQEFGARHHPNLTTMLAVETLDLLDVCTPQELHLEPVLVAVAAGLDVFCEKPLATSLADAERMVDAADRRGVSLAVDFNRRFSRPYQLAQEYQRAGRLGELSSLTLRLLTAGDPPSSQPYFALHDLLIHLADLARHFGGEIERVSALLSVPRNGVYRNAAVAIELASGAVGSLQVSLDGTRLHPIELAELRGPAGHAVVHNVVSGFDFFPHDSDLATHWRPQPFGGRDELLRFYPTTIARHVGELLAALLDGRPPPVTGRDALAAQRVVEAAIRSWENGRTVRVDEGES
jgi:predicted dehydrogenase